MTVAGDWEGGRERNIQKKKWPDLFSVNAGNRCCLPVPLHQISQGPERAGAEEVMHKQRERISAKIINQDNNELIRAISVPTDA